MHATQTLTFAGATLVVVLVSGCDRRPTMPEVNDENCKLENIEKIADTATRQEFGSKCFHRSHFRPSPKRE